MSRGRVGRPFRRVIVLVGLVVGSLALPAALEGQGQASTTGDLRISSFNIVVPNAGNVTSVVVGQFFSIECRWTLGPPPGYPTFVWNKGGSWKNEIWLDGHLSSACSYSRGYRQTGNPIYGHGLVEKCSVGIVNGVATAGAHTAACILNADGGVPEKAGDKGNNKATVSFSARKTMKNPSWPGH
jgi:hypothetical protein